MDARVNKQQAELLSDFGTSIGLTLAFDAAGESRLMVDEALIVMRARDDHFIFHGTLGEFPHVQSATFWKQALSLNASLIEQRQGAITVDLDSDQLAIMQSIDVRMMGPGQLSGALRDFVDQVNRLVVLLDRETALRDTQGIDATGVGGNATPPRGDMFNHMA